MLLWGPYRDLVRSRNIFWQNRWGYTCLGIDRLFPIKLVTCVDDSTTYDFIQQQHGIRFMSLEIGTGCRTECRDSALDEIVPLYRGEIEAVLSANSREPWVLVCPIPCRSLAAFAEGTGRPWIGTPADLGYWLNDKANFLSALDSLDLPKLPGYWASLARSRYSDVSSKLGSSFVAQLARGASGSGTAFIASQEDYELAGARLGDDAIWLAPDLGDLSLNINAVAMESGTAVSYPSVQLVGLPMLGCCRRGMYCGNDYAATSELSAETWQGVAEQTGRIGRWLSSLGFRGLFGLDFALDPSSGRAYAVDLNPRWQGSTGLLVQAEYKAGRLPLAVAGLAWQMGLFEESEILRHADGFLQPVAAAHMSLRNGASECARVCGDLRPGIYYHDFLRDGLYLDDLGAPEELLVNGGVPRQGACIGARTHIVRIASEQAVWDVGQMKLRPWSEAAAKMLYERLALTESEPSTPDKGHK